MLEEGGGDGVPMRLIAIHIFVTWKSTDNSYKFYRIYNDVYQRDVSLT